MDSTYFKNKIYKISSERQFKKIAIKLFNFQFKNNLFYKKYCDALKVNAESINKIEEIPFLPIEFFKTEKVLCENIKSSHHFLSSGTTSDIKSVHYVECLNFYERNILNCFEAFWGDSSKYCFLCLTPNKKNAPNSSLVHMCEFLINHTKKNGSGFYFQNYNALESQIKFCQKNDQPFIIFGLGFAILDFSEKSKVNLNKGFVIETGGMKNKRKEMIREELYEILKNKFNINYIQSEYGMTELLSQSYSMKDGNFKSPPWKKVLIRDKHNPLKINNNNTGGINVIDLSNIHSCAFIETQDLGRLNKNYFEVLGRLENTTLRGCNNLI